MDEVKQPMLCFSRKVYIFQTCLVHQYVDYDILMAVTGYMAAFLIKNMQHFMVFQ